MPPAPSPSASPIPARAPAPVPVSLSLDSPALAATYDQVGSRQFEHGKLLVADLGIGPAQRRRVLDVGCGTGLLTAHVAALLAQGRDPGQVVGQVVGIDPLPHRVAIARARALPNMTVEVGRAEDLSAFPDASFDVVYLNSVFHWLPDQERALREARRVVIPGGQIGISSAAKEQPHDIEAVSDQVAATLSPGQPRDRSTPYKVTTRALGALLTSTGFRPTALRVRTFVDHFQDLDEVLAFTRSSSFGNAGNAAGAGNDEARANARRALAEALEQRRSGGVIVLKRHLTFATAAAI